MGILGLFFLLNLSAFSSILGLKKKIEGDLKTCRRLKMKFEKERRSDRSPVIAAILSFLIPGAGQMYAGRVKPGVLWLVFVLAGYFLFIFPGLILHFFCVCSAYCQASTSPRPLFAGLAISLVLFAIWFAVVYHTFPTKMKDSLSFLSGFKKNPTTSDREIEMTIVQNDKVYSPRENETKAIDALREFLDAEEAYKEKHGRYTYEFGRLMAAGLRASIGSSEGADSLTEYYGYYFVPVKKHHTGWVNLKSMFVISAAPTVYKTTGTRTFVLGSAGKVLGKDNGGKPVTNVTQVDGSWEEL
jgi:TM2 domain-containing membrane protein YozV